MPLPLIYLGCGLISGFLFAANEKGIIRCNMSL